MVAQQQYQYNPQEHDRAVRAYLLALRTGTKPDIRPDCGPWANIVCELVERFEKYHGDAGAMARLFAVYERQYPQLADLLTSPSSSPTQEHDRNARAYLLALRTGTKPDIRPDCGQWTTLVEQFEEHFEKYHGNAEIMQRLFADACQKLPALADLLSSSSASCLIVPERDSGMPALPRSAQLAPGASTNACRWLDTYEQFSKEASPEGYEQYHVFCGIWALSTVAARRVYLPLQRKRLYGNLMIALYGPSSLYAKSTTAEVAIDVIKAAGFAYLLAPRKITPQKLLSDMAGTFDPARYDEASPARQERIRQKLAFAGQRGLFFDEFGKFVQGMLRAQSADAEFERIFLEFDGCPSEFDSSTISRGAETIEQPYLALLGCITPPNIRKIARRGADLWNNGVWGRFSFVAAPPEGGKDDTLEPGELPIPSELIAPLITWHERLGVPECEFAPRSDQNGNPTGKYDLIRASLPETPATIAQPAYDAYKRYRSALKALMRSFEHDDFNASYARLPDTMLRIALLMASLENDNRIELRHVARAQELAEWLRQSMHEIYTQANSREASPSRAADLEKKIESILAKKGAMTLKALYYDHLKRHHSLKEIEDALKAMHHANIIAEPFTAAGGHMKYRLADQDIRDDA